MLDLPLGAPQLTAPRVVMANVLGGDDGDLLERLHHVLAADPALRVHLYGKPARPGRKIGHVTALGDDVTGLRQRCLSAASYLRWGTAEDPGYAVAAATGPGARSPATLPPPAPGPGAQPFGKKN